MLCLNMVPVAEMAVSAFLIWTVVRLAAYDTGVFFMWQYANANSGEDEKRQ
jgi:hypothetical protein